MSDDTILQREPTPEEREKALAEAEKARAEAAKARAEAEKARVETLEAEHKAAVAALAREREEEKRRREKLHDDFDHHRYVFDTPVSAASVKECIKALNAWHRDNETCRIEIVFSSPGGSVVEGMELFDFISSLRASHEVTTSTYGMAASMAGILLQAGDIRICGPQAYILIHEVSFGTTGKIGEVEDEVKFVRKIQARVLDIFAARCAGASAETATRRLTRGKLARGWERKDWWIDADEALAFGLVDDIR